MTKSIVLLRPAARFKVTENTMKATQDECVSYVTWYSLQAGRQAAGRALQACSLAYRTDVF